MGRYSLDTSGRLRPASPPQDCAASRPAAIHDGGWQVSQVRLDKYAGVAHPEITGYSGKGSSEVRL